MSRLLIVAAVKAGRPPGTLSRLGGEEVPACFSRKLSPHQIGLPDLLLAARLRDLYPQEVVVLGIEPASLAVGVALSPEVAARLDPLVLQVLDELARWGVDVKRRKDADA